MAFMDKPIAARAMYDYIKKLRKNNNRVGSIPRSISIDYNNICNFKCEFCYELTDLKYNKLRLDFETIARVADEAYELGIFEIVLQGGELLVDLDALHQLIKALKPERFRVILVTNGYLLTEEVAVGLEKIGLDCVGISVSGMDVEEHDRSRRMKGSHKKVFEALENAKKAGLTTWIQPIFGHHNSKSEDFFELLDFAKEKGYGIYFFLAMPYGVWKDNYLDAEDIRIFKQIRKEYGAFYDTWDFYDNKKERISGCWAMNRIFITPKGDVLPCPFINIKVGNVKEQSLKEIFDYGFSIKHFSEYKPICIAAQDRQFRAKYLQGSSSMFHPPEAKDVFSEDDFV
ncbi:radical SAM protein [Clostridiales bacterium COT073_COT-073]|nr:radical SAM protein [Clostridiales bacterium COT073_COT-073]